MSDIKIYQMTPTRPPKGWKKKMVDRLPGEQVKIKCGSCKKSTRIPKAEFWGKIFRCVHCCEVIADERNLRIDQ